jgi:hypothetical protein
MLYAFNGKVPVTGGCKGKAPVRNVMMGCSLDAF